MTHFPAVTVTIPGTCGELAQGWHPDWDRPVLVSCPIACYSRITAQPQPGPRLATPARGPGGYAKLRQAARLALDYAGRPGLGAVVQIESRLRSGRGMAASTADVAGVMAALGLAVGRPLAPAELASLACQIEPSDSTMFTPLTILAYRDGGRFQELGRPPPLPLLMLDPGLAVDTVAFNRALDLAALRRLGPTTKASLALLRQGLVAENPAAIGAAAALSAGSYQTICDNPLVPQAQQWAKATGALGVVRAHSGSVVGLLYPPGTPLAAPARWVANRSQGQMIPTYLTAGGCRQIRLERSGDLVHLPES